MLHKELTFNDLPTVVNQLCEKIASLESMMEKHFATPVQKKENTHVPMSREEVCAWYHKIIILSQGQVRKTPGSQAGQTSPSLS